MRQCGEVWRARTAAATLPPLGVPVHGCCQLIDRYRRDSGTRQQQQHEAAAAARGSSSSASGNWLIQQQQQQSLRKRQARELKARLRPGSRATLSVRVALRTRWLRQQTRRANCELCLHELQRSCKASRRRASQLPLRPGWGQSSCMYCCRHPGKPKASRRESDALTSRRGPSSGKDWRCQGEGKGKAAR